MSRFQPGTAFGGAPAGAPEAAPLGAEAAGAVVFADGGVPNDLVGAAAGCVTGLAGAVAGFAGAAAGFAAAGPGEAADAPFVVLAWSGAGGVWDFAAPFAADAELLTLGRPVAGFFDSSGLAPRLPIAEHYAERGMVRTITAISATSEKSWEPQVNDLGVARSQRRAGR
jgi:hypothetical protein